MFSLHYECPIHLCLSVEKVQKKKIRRHISIAHNSAHLPRRPSSHKIETGRVNIIQDDFELLPEHRQIVVVRQVKLIGAGAPVYIVGQVYLFTSLGVDLTSLG